MFKAAVKSFRSDEVLEITSLKNPKIKEALTLYKKSQRDETGLFLVEGYRELLRLTQGRLEVKIKVFFYCPELFFHGINLPKKFANSQIGNSQQGCFIDYLAIWLLAICLLPQVTRCPMTLSFLFQRGLLFQADLLIYYRTPAGKYTTLWQCYRTGYIPFQNNPLFAPCRIRKRNSRQQRFSIWMQVTAIQLTSWSSFDNTAEVHNGNLCTYVSDHAEVVGDEKIR